MNDVYQGCCCEQGNEETLKAERDVIEDASGRYILSLKGRFSDVKVSVFSAASRGST